MVIEKQANSMLELVLEIAQRTTALERFHSQVKNPKTGATEPFAPSCCRLKNPMSASRLLQDEDAYKAIVVSYDELIEKFKQDARNLLHQSAKLEVTTRKELLKNELLKSLKRISNNISTQEFVRNSCLIEPVKFILNEKEVAYQAASEYINSLTSDTVKQWHFTTKQTANDAFINTCLEEGVDLDKIEEKALETDYACITIVKTKITELFPKMTVDLWMKHKEKDLLRKINAAQAVLNQKQEQNEMNEQVAMDLDTEQTVNATQLSNILNKMLDEKLKKEKSKQRKNSSADVKNQTSKATKNGHGLNNSSNRGRERSSTNSSKKSSNQQKSNSTKTKQHRSQSREQLPREQKLNRRSNSRTNSRTHNIRSKSPSTSTLRNGRYNTQQVRFGTNNTNKRENHGESSNAGRRNRRKGN
jgi:hypothetical protein